MIDGVITSAFGAAGAGVGSFLVWLVFRRPRDREDHEVDRVKRRLDVLESQRMTKVETEIDQAKNSRGKLHDRFAILDAETMKRSDCEAAMRRQEERWGSRTQEFTAAVLKLERVGERVDVVVKRLESVSEETIHTQTDIAALAAQVQALKERS